MIFKTRNDKIGFKQLLLVAINALFLGWFISKGWFIYSYKFQNHARGYVTFLNKGISSIIV